MNTRVVYAKRAAGDLQLLDKATARRIVLKIRWFAEQKNPLRSAKPLKPPFADLWRFRIGDYRVVFRIDKTGAVQVLLILRIGHRKEVYE